MLDLLGQGDTAEKMLEAIAGAKEIEIDKALVALSSVMTWTRTSADTDEPEKALTEEEYKRRRPHSNFKELLALEKMVVKSKRTGLRTHVVRGRAATVTPGRAHATAVTLSRAHAAHPRAAYAPPHAHSLGRTPHAPPRRPPIRRRSRRVAPRGPTPSAVATARLPLPPSCEHASRCGRSSSRPPGCAAVAGGSGADVRRGGGFVPYALQDRVGQQAAAHAQHL